MGACVDRPFNADGAIRTYLRYQIDPETLQIGREHPERDVHRAIDPVFPRFRERLLDLLGDPRES